MAAATNVTGRSPAIRSMLIGRRPAKGWRARSTTPRPGSGPAWSSQAFLTRAPSSSLGAPCRHVRGAGRELAVDGGADAALGALAFGLHGEFGERAEGGGDGLQVLGPAGPEHGDDHRYEVDEGPWLLVDLGHPGGWPPQNRSSHRAPITGVLRSSAITLAGG